MEVGSAPRVIKPRGNQARVLREQDRCRHGHDATAAASAGIYRFTLV
jgi:hypothetical protein